MDADGLDQQALDSELLSEEIAHNQKYGCYSFDLRAMRRATEHSDWSLDDDGKPEHKWTLEADLDDYETIGYYCNRCDGHWMTLGEAQEHVTRSVQLAAARRLGEAA